MLFRSKTLVTVVEFVLYRDLCEALGQEELNVDRFHKIVEEMKRWPMERDKPDISYVAGQKIDCLMAKFAVHPENIDLMQTVEVILINLNPLKLKLDLWKAQNIYFAAGKKLYTEKKKLAQEDGQAQIWLSSFENLGKILQVKIQ